MGDAERASGERAFALECTALRRKATEVPSQTRRDPRTGPRDSRRRMPTLVWMGISLAFALAAFAVLGLRVGYPRHRRLAFGVWALGWIPLGISFFQHQSEIEGRSAVVTSALSGHELHVGLVCLFLVVGYLVRVLFPTHAGVVPELDEDELTARVGADLAQLVFLLDRVDEATTALTDSGLCGAPAEGFSAADDDRLRALWAELVEASFELDVLKSQYRSFYSVNPLTRSGVHARCFLVAYAAYVGEYRAGMLVTHAVGEDLTVRTVLDEANARFDIPKDSFLSLARRSMHPDTLVRLNVGRAYLNVQAERLKNEPLLARTRTNLADIEAMVGSSPSVFVENPLAYLERVAFDLWFPIQKNVTVGISAVHLPSREHFIGAGHLFAAEPRLEPGDTILARREWHLTNLGIPGYWTHAALYSGTLAKIDAYFEGLPELEGRPASALIRERRPEAYALMSAPDEAGYPIAVVEAVTAGVKVSSLEKAGSSDALAALRPRISKIDKLRAILDALGHVGKPYDYNFDLATDNELVCSELVYKAYQRAEGIELTPESFNGRLLFSPNALCEKLDAEYDSEPRQLDFALFLDGVAPGEVEDRDAAALRESHRRPKWHILLVESGEALDGV